MIRKYVETTIELNHELDRLHADFDALMRAWAKCTAGAMGPCAADVEVLPGVHLKPGVDRLYKPEVGYFNRAHDDPGLELTPKVMGAVACDMEHALTAALGVMRGDLEFIHLCGVGVNKRLHFLDLEVQV